MSKLTDIKYRIDQLDGGAFQNLCDAYLACRGYGAGYSLGMKTGTDKTAKGNPDTYFLTTNGKYVFVMYTTQTTNFVDKALEDLQKCFDPEKTGLSPAAVSEIIYCHTFGRLSAGDHQRLHLFCEERNAILTLIGLDELGYDLYLKYPRLAKDFLGISVTTGQISSMHEFIQAHDANKMSAPLNTTFLLREKELKAAQEKLSLSDVLILSGPAGAGKTRLALQLCETFAAQSAYEVICIKSNGLELYEDLISSLEPEKSYLVFVDDANELTGLHFVLDYLPRATIGRRCIKKVIMTVRDYARQQVINQVLEVEKPEVLRIGLLDDADIRKLIETTFGITNRIYSDRIVAIAEGNARLAMLAGKLAAETGKITSIQDASALYDHYYGKQIETIANSTTGVASAGIMAFFQVLHLDRLERLQPIFAAANLTEDQFIADLKQLHYLELVDICHDKAVKISDQSFSNYLIKYVFVDKKNIPLSQMIECCFFINREKTISACNILLNVFSDKLVQEYVEQQINIVWDHLRSDTDRFEPFLTSFYMVRPTETLVLLKSSIDQEVSTSFDIKTLDFKKTDGEKSIDDNIISILCGFALHSQLPEAIDLLLVYYQKRPDLFEQIYSAFSSQLGVNKDSHRYDYYTQKTVVEKLCKEVENTPSMEISILFVRVAEQFLRLYFSRTEGGRKNTFTFYTVPLTQNEVVFEYRKALLNQLYKIYEQGKCQKEIESFLMDYCKAHGEVVEYKIVRQELEHIIPFFMLLSPENLYHCVIAEHIKKVAKNAEYDCGDVFDVFLTSRKYKIYNTLNPDRSEMLHLGFREYEELHRNQISEMVQQYSLYDFQYLISVCKECLETVDLKAQQLSFGVECAIDAISANKELYIDVVTTYLAADTPYDIRPYQVLCNLFTMMSAKDVKRLILSYDFSQKNAWLWSFYVELPAEQISTEWANDLLLYFDSVPQNIRSSPYRPIDEIERYECVDDDIIIKASKIIASHYEESPFIFSLYFSLMMNPHRAEAKKIIAKYQKDTSLLEDIYLKCIAYSNHDDYDGHFLAELLKNNPDFFYCYLDKILESTPHLYSSHDQWTSRLKFIWGDDSFMTYMDQLSDYIIEKVGASQWIYSSILGHLLSHGKEESDIAEKQEHWIHATIKKFYLDKHRMYGLFNAISELNSDCRKKALGVFLRLNNDYTLFKNLPLEASGWGGSGSMIPYMQERITYLTSLLPMLSGIDYLQHKQRVEHYIEAWKERIKHEEIQELLESLG